MPRGRNLALRQQKWSAISALPRSCLDLNVMASALPRSHLFCLASTRGIETSKLRYDNIIYNFQPFIYFNICVSKTKLHQCTTQRLYMQAKRVRRVCCDMNLVYYQHHACHHLHGSLTALLRPRTFGLGLASALSRPWATCMPLSLPCLA